jgi:two-component system response regulator MprA
VPPTAHLLLVDPDTRSSDLLTKHLQVHGFVISAVASTDAAQQQLPAAAPQMLLISDAFPDSAALVFTRQLRAAANSIPLVLLLSFDHYSSRVAALEAGADDVLSRPFAIEELIARLRALLRRSRMGLNHVDGVELHYRDLTVNTDSRLVSRASTPVKLTVKEYDLLLHLLQHSEQVLSRKDILLAVWGDSWVGDDNLLDVYIRYLRKKLERPDLETLIHTVRGVGFMLN